MTQYTFEDWLEGRSINWIQLYMKQGYKYTPDQLSVKKEIKEAQKKAWSWLVDLNAEFWINHIKDESEGYIEAFKKEKRKFFDDNLDLVKRYEKGKFEGIDHKKYKKLKALFETHHKKGGIIIGVSIQKDGKGYPGRLQDVYVFKKVLQHLEKRPDPQSEKIISIATSGLQRKNKKHAKEFLNEYADIKNENPGLNISDYIRKIGMTKTSDVTYREWIEKFDKAEQMLSNDE